MRLDEVVVKTVELLGPMAEEHQVTVVTEILAPTPCRMLGDACRVQQVIWNLLTNAIKFSELQGTVFCRLTREGDDWLIRVIDQGRGISAHQLQHVFERFQQTSGSDQHTEAGWESGSRSSSTSSSARRHRDRR